MPAVQKSQLHRRAESNPKVRFFEFTGELIGFIAAADIVVSMAGYNTVCEILSLNKRAIVIPRVRPTQEQLIRAERMSRLGLFETIHADELDPQRLMQAVHRQLDLPVAGHSTIDLNLDGLPIVAGLIDRLLTQDGNGRS
jgi:predicted glycosyltransferase